MPMLLGSKGSDVLSWRASTELLAGLKDALTRHWEQSPVHSAESLLEQFIAALDQELAFDKRLETARAALERDLEAAATAADLLLAAGRFRDAITRHFKRRRSVLALCGLCNTLHDLLVSRAVTLVQERLSASGRAGAPPCALLVAGDRGRGESTLFSRNRYYLLHDGAPRLNQFRDQLEGLFQELGLVDPERPLWHGSLREWQAQFELVPAPSVPPPQEEFLAALPPFAAPNKSTAPVRAERDWLIGLADLGYLWGSEQLASPTLEAAAAALAAERDSEWFLQYARRGISQPLGVGRFGRWRLERSGERRALLDLKRYALDPVQGTLRILALAAGSTRTGSVARLTFLLERGILDVDLAGRLLNGYQCIMQLKVLLEIRGARNGLFLNPEEFSDETETRFRAALEAVLGLQKLGYQFLIGPV
ncbi:hypothetical protein GMLC_04490 [Geomonas limicola]|uniref:Nucleotidyltransferase n=1 Tax=Geomonas limicola TaxID=2740186 RepID=A0A6V8N3D1_9BACT|nr:putative nucleotidyltransferase substrate binding domain-containing protein [Geomonas limicola]GFO66870.1 hypothetical protein GMLC_04490 [Geomonas limicola]